MRFRVLMCLVLAIALASLGGNAAAQGRISDKDLENLMNNMKEDSKNFSEAFKDDLEKSTIRKTSDEKTAKQLSEQFPKQVEGMLSQFKDKRQVNTTLPAVQLSHKRLDEYMNKISPSRRTVDLWARVTQELEKINQAFNVSPPAGS
jgi:cytochrome c556